MSQQIDYRSTSPHPADEIYATMVDPDFLQARLAAIGGPGAALLEHHADGEGARYRLRHGIDPKAVPSVVRSVMPSNITIERTERWTRRDGGHYLGDVDVAISGAPGSVAGGMRLRDVPDEGSELQVRVDVTVKVPLIGGKIEGVVVEQLRSLLDMESAFTQKWLAGER
jgi:Protein of unknown function (DUF2505)